MELASEMLVCLNHVMWLSAWECFIESYFDTVSTHTVHLVIYGTI